MAKEALLIHIAVADYAAQRAVQWRRWPAAASGPPWHRRGPGASVPKLPGDVRMSLVWGVWINGIAADRLTVGKGTTSGLGARSCLCLVVDWALA